MNFRCLLLLSLLPLAAQAQDPFGGAGKAGEKAPHEKAADAAAQPPAEIKITNPLVQTLLDTKPSTPSNWMLAINTLIDLKHAPVARQFVNSLLAANLSEEQLVELHREYGSPTFLRIGAQPELAPEGQKLAELVLTAAAKQAQDPARLAQFIAQLSDPSPKVRSRALAELRRGDAAAVLAMIAVLADDGRAAEHAAIRTALAALRANAMAPLIAALESDNTALKVQVVEVLGRLGTADPAIYLLGPALSPNSPPELQVAARQALERLLRKVPDVASAAGMLYAKARTEYDRSVLIRGDTEPRSIWSWDAAAAAPAAQSHLPSIVSLLEATRLAGDLYQLQHESPTVRRLYLASALELAAHQAGLDEPLPTGPGTAHDLAAEAGPEALQQVLAHATTTGHLAAATAAVQILGEIGDSELLFNRGPQPTLLVEAALHADPRLRFAAVATIMKLLPDRQFPGSSQVLSALINFAASAGQRRAIVLDTHLGEATRLASLLEHTGFEEVDTTNQPRDFLLHAAAQPDYELALVDFNLPRTNVDELLQMLRHDHRSRHLPVMFVASTAEDLQAARYVAEHIKLVGVLVRPPDQAGLEVQVNSFLPQVSAGLLPRELRLQQARQSLEWLLQLASPEKPRFNVQRAAKVAEAALTVPDLAHTAATLLADLGTAGSQPALVLIANRLNLPLELRQTAAQAFRHSVHRHGILLTSGEMLYQYERYNASETEPAEHQELLASILDTLENARREAPK